MNLGKNSFQIILARLNYIQIRSIAVFISMGYYLLQIHIVFICIITCHKMLVLDTTCYEIFPAKCIIVTDGVVRHSKITFIWGLAPIDYVIKWLVGSTLTNTHSDCLKLMTNQRLLF